MSLAVPGSIRTIVASMGMTFISCCVAIADQASPHAESAVAAAAMVRAIRPEVVAPRPPAASVELIEKYYASVHSWGMIVAARLRPVEGDAERLYLGLPEHTENDVRPTAYAAMVLAFLAKYQPPKAVVDEADRAGWRSSAIGLLRYLTASHVSGGGACVNGKPWGNQWQSAMWARAAGMAGWLLWDDLDQDLRSGVVGVVVFEADRFLAQPPKSSVRNDTGAEENAWNALVTSLACNMLPEHPRARAWEEASLRYLYNTFSVAADANDSSLGDGGRPINQWVTTINAHDDFTLENHGLVHMGYLKNAVSELQENALPWLIRGREIPAACRHHASDVFEVLVDCMAWDGGPVYFAGTDWKSYHEQCTEIVLYAMLGLQGDRRAAFLEHTALEAIAAQQRTQQGFYNVRRDLEYGGLCATRLMACCLAHGILGPPPAPVSADEFDAAASGTRHFAAGMIVVHRTPTKFASFTWAQKRMALAIPREGTWVIWPHFSSYLGIFDGRDSSQAHARIESIGVDLDSDGFRASGSLARCGGKLIQDFYYASPAGDYTVFIERLRTEPAFQPASRETGVVGMEYALGINERRLYGAWGTLRASGYGGDARIHRLESNWLNIDNRVGYVVLHSDGRQNVIRYHDENQGSGRVPHLQEWISLVGEKEGHAISSPAWDCIVTFLNQAADETERWASRVQFSVDGDVAACTVGDETLTWDLRNR